VLPCPNLNCLGGVNGYCGVGYMGPYCSVCQPGYSQAVSGLCEMCNSAGSLTAPIVVMVLGGLLATLALVYYIRLQLQDPDVSHKDGAGTVSPKYGVTSVGPGGNKCLA
jgi:hypothetical protein